MSTQKIVRVASLVGGLIVVCVLCGIGFKLKLDNLSPAGIFALVLSALVNGVAAALMAVGIVLVYRSSRVINFAHAAFGVVSAALFFQLATYVGVPYFLALAAGIAAGALLGAVVELLIVRRFMRSPRLVLAVATIGVAQLLGGLAGFMPSIFGDDDPAPGLGPTPLNGQVFKIEPVLFRGNHVLLVVLGGAMLIGLTLFLTKSKVGMAIRGAAENDDRAALLGVNTGSLSTIVWALAGTLSAAGTLLLIPVTGYSAGAAASAIGAGALLTTLAAAVIGGMDDLPVTVVAALSLSVFQSTIFTMTGRSAYVDLAILGVLIVTFVVRRKRLQRTDESSTSSWAATEEVRPIPRELASLRTVRVGARRFIGVLVFIVLGYPMIASPSQVNIGSLFVLYGIVMISLVILTGWGGQVSLGQFAFVATGAVVTGSLTAKTAVPFFPALIAGGLAGAVAAMFLGLTALRIRGLYLAVTTLAFAVAMTTVGLSRAVLGSRLPDSVNRPVILFLETEDERVFYYLCIVALVAAWWAALGLRRSRTGRVLIALRENERAAEAYGINVVRSRLATFAISGFFAAIAGGLLAVHQRAISADSFGSDQSVQIFLTAVIGGLGSIQGALLGGVYLGLVNLVIPSGFGRLLASSLGVLLVLLFFPTGLGGMAYAARDAVLRRIALRRRISVPSLFGDRKEDEENPRVHLPPSATPVTTRYRLPSGIRTFGSSQTVKTWNL